jgi:diguanylate cyclase (GGDEF)-like protein
MATEAARSKGNNRPSHGRTLPLCRSVASCPGYVHHIDDQHSKTGMAKIERILAPVARIRDLWLIAATASGALALAWWILRSPAWRDPLLFSQLQFASGILAITFAAAALVRFRATGDRLPLVLASGFVLVGVAMAGPSVLAFRGSGSISGAVLRDPLTWVISRTFLALLFVAALVVEKRHPKAQNTAREIIVALVLVAVCTAALTTAHWRVPAALVVSPGRFFPRPANLVVAAVFLLASVRYRQRMTHGAFPSDHALYYAAGLNVVCSVAAGLSRQLLDAPFLVAGILQFTSYAVLLGGAFFDDMQLFEDVRRLSVSDPLTGVGNYRHLLDAVEREIQRSERTGRAFALLLLDLDGLKKLNDVHGHLVGSRALCRVATALLLHSRSMDTCARYGGDEFALVLPETAAPEALDAADRICARVTEDAEEPRLSISAGIAVYPTDGTGIESLIRAADRALYHSKRHPVFEPHPHSEN